MNDQPRPDAFLAEIAQALHASGSPAHDLERIIGELGARLGLTTQCFSLPTMISITVEEPDGGQRVKLQRLPPSDYNMVRLMKLEAVAGNFSGYEDLEESRRSVRAVMKKNARWSGAKLIFFGFLLSGSVAGLFKGGVVEMLCGGLIGTVFVSLYLPLSKIRTLEPVRPVILCATSAFLAKALALALPGQVVFISTLSGIVLLLPGFTTTIALSELATMNLISGVGRLAGAFILMVMMGAGVATGAKLGDMLLPAVAGGVSQPIPVWGFWICVAALGVSFVGVLQAPLRSVFVMAGSSLAACALSMSLTPLAGEISAAFVAAFAVAITAHLWHRITGKPALLFQVPGLLVLVPGSVGFRGLNALIEQNFVEGIKITTDMLLTATALAVGTLLANGIAPMLLRPRAKAGAEVRAPGIR